MSLTQRNCSIFENLLLKNKEEIEDLEEVDEYDIKIVNGLLDFEEYLENDGIIISQYQHHCNPESLMIARQELLEEMRAREELNKIIENIANDDKLITQRQKQKYKKCSCGII